MKALVRGAALLVAVSLAGSCGRSDSPPLALGAEKLTVVVAVVDSLMPDEITAAATPQINTLKANGTFFEQSRSVVVAETIPNHVAMMTGVYPARNGIFSNDYLDFSGAAPAETRLQKPERLTANTLFTWIDRHCNATAATHVHTGATLSKKYLFEVFRGDAADPAEANDDPDVFNAPPESYWDPEDDPAYIGRPSFHTPDTPTMTQALTQLPGVDFMFINLGDVDRLAHAGGAQARSGALAEADTQIGNLVTELQNENRWNNTVMILLSDHGMDYSPVGPANAISTQATLTALGACFKPMKAVASGQGTEGIYVLDRAAPLEDRQAALRAARACLLGTEDCATLCPGATRPVNAPFIETAWYNVDDPLDPAGTMPASVQSRHRNAGDLLLTARGRSMPALADGYKFAEPDPTNTNGQIPGNHGHPITFRDTFLITGGSAWVKKGVSIAPSVANPGPLDRLPEQSETIDVAPTVAWLLGLDIPPYEFPDYAERGKGFDGRVLKEAFTPFDNDPNARPPTVCGRF